MKGERVAITTLGCKVNQYESAVLAGTFRDRGYRLVEFEEEADIYIINTCTVTHLGDRKSRQLIRRAARTNPGALIAVTGCYAQVSPEEVLAIPGVDLVVGTKDRTKLVELVETAEKGLMPVNAVSSLENDGEFEEIPALPLQERTRAYLKIQDGCNNFCTYCIVPYARGSLRSRRPERILEMARELTAAGYKEIVLTGIHTGSYGEDLADGVTLAGLLNRLVLIPGLSRVRLSSLEPNDITPELVEILAGSPVFCRHLHIPLQSGDDQVLRRMGRRYTAGEYTRLVNVLRENIPGLGLTTDVMAGFPGETDECYNNTYRLLKKSSFSKLHVFKYSPRPGTPAAGFTGQIEPAVKEARSRKLIGLGGQMAAGFAASLLGQVLEVLVERQYQEEAGLYEGLTDNYVRALFPGSRELIGSIVKVKAEEVRGAAIKGRIV
ncbi:tRNA (N(6)-L-threonylcarbamoyladenosine(37)-C(2))-methylthiotransferase MtaB [Pelotomaculum terephthalicicum JT]|uniref:tRNA (N(6)-L-threonylcarbamoyladenosine(37)-C(2))- methylthiotransferase MtaB n=1 Tax=Pelotomaculum TaxID=191373 RepID=UPI0009D197E9|nr:MULTISPECIES: tRNA (N(6)-L-threonylcarbamoyladenosine(37)-C(2))-methylthiotransferase MtaB [Pelotomaculum]MCG9967043.1 tRNA (N(6)-L-threonylcarbamoyladenosine(37)-C(2))-methylthiotransferase MtaB [Pelotomaculum terephthalicicum JT]OPX90510.1 MAG: Threonylcarbamoyladenosine tRNA methylthiotransferase MtaB [Pelotomaculum sp. PtaB.Bin117]OPY63912.1 MAG: Threonylcarbamoyladenosine tRNA methylthiotransferase MtaB [Pelotomaculum sp. PtaU1.Bin065]